MRASGPAMHVFALGEGLYPLSLDRPLRMRERSGLQGFPASIGNLQFDETVGRRIFGNAMAVPVIGSILAQELLSFMVSLPSAALAAACGGDGGILHPEIPRVLVYSPVTPTQGIQSELRAASPDSALIHPRTEGLSEENPDADVLLGVRAACTASAANIRSHWASGQPGRAPRPRPEMGPADESAIAERSQKRERRVHSADSLQDNLGLPSTQRQASVGHHDSPDISESNSLEQDVEDFDEPMCGFASKPANSKYTQELPASARSPLLEVARQQAAVCESPDKSCDEPVLSFA